MKLFFTILTALIISLNTNAQVGIGTTTPDPNTILDISSKSKGILVPRLTEAERDAQLADNKASTIYPDNDPPLTTQPAPADYLETGTIIFNTDDKLLEYWDGDAFRWVSIMTIKGFSTGNDGQVLMNFPEFNDAGAVKYNLAAELLANIHINADSISYDENRVAQTPIPITYAIEESVFGPLVTADFTESDFEIAAEPTTSWPDNAFDTSKAGVWDDTNKTLVENNLAGQVHFWRFVIEYQAPSGNSQKGSFQASLINPNPASTFSTEHTSTVIDSKNGEIVRTTFLFMTVADSFSLPHLENGGKGYQLGLRANTDITVSIRSILRVSLFKD